MEFSQSDHGDMMLQLQKDGELIWTGAEHGRAQARIGNCSNVIMLEDAGESQGPARHGVLDWLEDVDPACCIAYCHRMSALFLSAGQVLQRLRYRIKRFERHLNCSLMAGAARVVE